MLLDLRNSSVETHRGNQSPLSESLSHAVHILSKVPGGVRVPGGVGYSIDLHSCGTEKTLSQEQMFRRVPERDEWEADGPQLLRTDQERHPRDIVVGCSAPEGDLSAPCTGEFFPQEGLVAQTLELSPAVPLTPSLRRDLVTPRPVSLRLQEMEFKQNCTSHGGGIDIS